MFKHTKDVGSSPAAFEIFFIFFFDLLVSLSLFLMHLFEFGMRLCNKYSTVNNFTIGVVSYASGLHVINSLHAEYFLRFLLSSARSDF